MPNGVDGLPPLVDLADFRILQEALSNVIRRAAANVLRATWRFNSAAGEN